MNSAEQTCDLASASSRTVYDQTSRCPLPRYRCCRGVATSLTLALAGTTLLFLQVHGTCPRTMVAIDHQRHLAQEASHWRSILQEFPIRAHGRTREEVDADRAVIRAIVDTLAQVKSRLVFVPLPKIFFLTTGPNSWINPNPDVLSSPDRRQISSWIADFEEDQCGWEPGPLCRFLLRMDDRRYNPENSFKFGQVVTEMGSQHVKIIFEHGSNLPDSALVELFFRKMQL